MAPATWWWRARVRSARFGISRWWARGSGWSCHARSVPRVRAPDAERGGVHLRGLSAALQGAASRRDGLYITRAAGSSRSARLPHASFPSRDASPGAASCPRFRVLLPPRLSMVSCMVVHLQGQGPRRPLEGKAVFLAGGDHGQGRMNGRPISTPRGEEDGGCVPGHGTSRGPPSAFREGRW